jgi:membrane-associated phospholipid phosphatase
MNQIIVWDQALFKSINSGLANPFFDVLMPLLRYPSNWIPFYVFFAAFLLYNFKRQGLYTLLLGVLAILISDQLSSSVIKPLVHRLRPCNDMSIAANVRLLISNCGSGFSFPSSHAVNHFTFALFLICMLPASIKWVKPVLLIWASFIAFSQVYIGIHYPIDILFGAILGSFIGCMIAYIGKGIFHVILKEELEDIQE